MYVAAKVKDIDREKLANIAIWAFLSFSSFLLVLMVNSVGIKLWYLDEILIPLIYSYFMSDAALFDEKR